MRLSVAGLHLFGTTAGSRERSVNPRWVIAGYVIQSALRGAVIWGAVFGLYVLATVQAFMKGYPTLDGRLQLAHSLQSFAILLGVPHHAETVAGFTMWRVLTAILFIGGIWGLLTSTALLRGEEDAGRWELLLVGPTTKRRATAQVLLGLGATLAAMFVVTTPLVLAAGRLPGARFSVGESLLFAAALVSGAAMFLAIGALASQLSATRSQAATLAAAVLGASFVVRMVADSSNSLGWLRWVTPLGWVEELHPLRDPQPLALAPIITLVLVCTGLAIILAGSRDLGASVLPEGEGRRSDTWWLIGPISLAVRLSMLTALSWLVGIAGFAAMFGYVARSSVSVISSSPAIVAVLGRLGVRTATLGFLGFALFFVDVLIAVMAASQVGAIRDEEAAGRLDNLLVRPVHRVSWLAGRLAVSMALVVLVGLAAGLGTWIGAASHHVYVALPTMVEAGLNATIPGVFVLGAGALVLGLRPRLSAGASYAIVAWSFLVDLLGSLVKGADWLRDSSLFTHIKLAPAAKPDWETAAVIVLLGIGAAVIGAIAFQRRDVEYT
jgi:ABC-2 type transport system permease protein